MAITPPSAITVTIDPLPQPPQTSDPANFDTRADAFVLAEQTFSQQVELGRKQINENAISVASNAATVQAVAQNVLNAPTTQASSTSSHTIGAGSKTFTGLDPSKVLGRGQFVVVAASSAPTNYMLGQVTSPQAAGSVTVNISSTGGSGTFSAWDISLQGVQQVVQRHETRRVVKTAGFTAGITDHGVVFELSSATAATMAFDPAATLGNGWSCWWVNTGASIWTIDPNGAEQIDGVNTFSILPGEARLVTCGGSNFATIIIKPFFYTMTASGTFPILAPGYGAITGFLWGSGQGGGQNTDGGTGSAATPFHILRADLVTAQTVTIGASVAGVASPTRPAGNNSAFGTLVTAYAPDTTTTPVGSRGLLLSGQTAQHARLDPFGGGISQSLINQIGLTTLYGGALGGSAVNPQPGSVFGGDGGLYTAGANGGSGQAPGGGGAAADSGFVGGASGAWRTSLLGYFGVITMPYARIVDGIVANVEIWEEEPPTLPGVTFVETDQAVRGDLWNGQQFVRSAPAFDRPLLPKSTVTARLIDLGLAVEVKAALDADAVSWARWISPDWPNVYADDDGLSAFLTNLGLTEAQIALVTAP